MAKKKKKQPVRRPPANHTKQRPNAPLFDQDIAPVPRQAPRNGQMQQVILPLGGTVPSAPPKRNHPPKKTKKNRNKQAVHKRRVTQGEMRRRRIRRRILACVLIFLLVILGAVLSVTVLFKVTDYRIENLDKSQPADTGIYSEDAILSALGIPLEENMYEFSLKEKERQMALELPYLETIEVRRSLPGTLVVRVKPAVEAYKIRCAGGWAVVSPGMKVLDVRAEEPSGLLLIEGQEALHPAAGQPLRLDLLPEPESDKTTQAPSSEESSSQEAASTEQPQSNSEPEMAHSTQPILDTLSCVLEGLAIDDLVAGVDSVQISDLNEISFVYQGRVKVLLGTVNTMDYKLEWARYILLNRNEDGLGPNDRGRLDISHVRDDGSIQPLFTPGPLEEQPRPAPTPAPPPPAEETDTTEPQAEPAA